MFAFNITCYFFAYSIYLWYFLNYPMSCIFFSISIRHDVILVLLFSVSWPSSTVFWPSSTTHCVKSVGEIRSTSPYSVWMQKNADQNNSEYRHFLRTFLTITDYLTQNTMFSTWIRCISIIKYINNTFSIKFKNHKKISLIYL